VTRRGARNETYIQPLKVQHHSQQPILSAPIGNRSILASVRAQLRDNLDVPGGHASHMSEAASDGYPSSTEKTRKPSLTRTPMSYLSPNNRPTLTSGYMTRGQAGARRPLRHRLGPGGIGDQMAWISNIKWKKEGSLNGSAGQAGLESGPTSRLTSRSRATSVDQQDLSARELRRSDSRSIDVEAHDKETPEHLADEYVLTRCYGLPGLCVSPIE
jgi:hypothetical protein